MSDRSSSPDLDGLWRAFTSPPDHARPHAWWHWMDGNIDPAGIARDLTWMHRIGLRGAHIFEGGMGGPLFLPEAVRPGSDCWREAVETAGRVAAEHGMELAVATSSGWSAAGAPWVQPADAMKKLVWADVTVRGGRVVDVHLPPLPATAGLYQDCPLWRGSPDPVLAVPWRVLAVPYDPAHDPLRPDEVVGSAPLEHPERLWDGSYAATVDLPRDPDDWSSAWIEQRFDHPVTVRSVALGLPGPGGFGAAPAPLAVLEAADESGAYREVARLEPGTAPARTASFPPVTSRRFRLTLSGASAAQALPPQGDGVRLPPVLRPIDVFPVAEFALREAGSVHHAEAKAGFGVAPDYDRLDTDPASVSAAVDPAAVIDLTESAVGDQLTWDAPPGRWRILRFGASPTGKTNGPALPDATGLEIDKLDGSRVAGYIGRHLRDYRTDGLTALLSDSIESGAQNWTESMGERFRELRGYDPTPWLPALAGYVVGDAPRTDRFLHDYRRTIADLLAEEYYGTLSREAHERGLTYYAEALEDGRPQLGDDLAMRAHADVPMGAMWAFDPGTGPRPTYVADLKGASSTAHVHGRSHTGAEAFTAFTTPWSFSPRALKHVADLQLSLGVTRLCIHTSPHQPLAAPPPGVSLAPFLGQTFTVHETWAELAGPWIDYLARCSALLLAGEPDVQVAVFIGEEAPVTGLYDTEPDRTVPAGYDFDYVGPHALDGVLHVADGELASRGARYRMLYLGGSSDRLSVATLRRLAALADAGAVIIGSRPSAPRSLADDDFDELCDRLWGDGTRPGPIRDLPLQAALEAHGVRPSVEIADAGVRWIARRLGDTRLVFLANPSPEPLRTRVRVPGTGVLCAWDPVTAQRSPAPADDAGWIDIDLPPSGSLFLVPDDRPAHDAPPVRVVPVRTAWRLRLPGLPDRELPGGPVPWTDLGPAERAFSGIAEYVTEIDVPDPGGRMELDLGDVHDIAEVLIDGTPCGIAWTALFRVDVTDALRPGRNTIRVRVATPWRNRLIAEASAAAGDLPAALRRVFEPDAPVRTAGLAGPIRLRHHAVPGEGSAPGVPAIW